MPEAADPSEPNGRSANEASQRPIHVLHVIDKLSVDGSRVHGIGKAIEWWIQRFDRNRYRFSLASLRAPEPFGEVLERQGTPVTFINKGKLDPTTLTSLLGLIRRTHPDVLHLHGYGASNFGRLAGAIEGIPNIVHEHTVIDSQPLHQTVADMLLAPLTTSAIAISARVRDFMIERRHVDPKKLETFFYGLPLEKFEMPDPDAIATLRSEFGIPLHAPVVGSIGRLDRQKGLVHLIEAAALVVERHPDTRFLVAGEGPDREMLTEEARVRGLDRHVVFAGYRSDVPVVIGACDVFAIPSLWEGGPITLFEAMCLGKPVVGTPVGVIDEVLEDGESGFVVPIGDSRSLAEAISRLLRDPALARRVGERAATVVRQYDLGKSVDRLDAIYRRLAGR